MKVIGNARSIRNAAGGSTIEPKIHTSRSDDERARWPEFRDIKTLQKFASVHASIHNHFNLDRHLTRRETSSRTAPPHWPSGGNWRPEQSLRRGLLETGSH